MIAGMPETKNATATANEPAPICLPEPDTACAWAVVVIFSAPQPVVGCWSFASDPLRSVNDDGALSESERCAAAQHGVGFGRKATVALMQHQARR